MTELERQTFLDGVRLFNAGQFFEAHEVWEDAWRPMAPGTQREFLQGLIQCAVALEHHRRGNAIGAARVLERAGRRLANVPTVYDGVDVSQLLRGVLAALQPDAPSPVIHLHGGIPPQPGRAGPVSED